MAIFRKEWASPQSGFKMRLDIMGWSDTLSASVTTLTPDEGVFIAVGELDKGFDGLPIGLCSAMTLKIEFVFDRLPADLKTIVRSKGSGSVRALFMLFCDRGSGTVTDHLEFCGTAKKISGTSYKRSGNTLTTSIELVDAMHYALASTTMHEILNSPTFPSVTATHGVLYDIAFSGAARTDAWHDARVSATGWSDKYKAVPWNTVMHAVQLGVSSVFTAKCARTANGSGAALESCFDSTNEFDAGFFNASTFYKCSTTYPRAVGAALTGATTLLVTNILSAADGSTIGGIVANNDKYSWAAYKSAWDWLKDLAETFNAKVGYAFTYNAGGGSPFISTTFFVRPPLAVKVTAGTPVALSLNKALNEIEILETEAGIGSAEVRTETENQNDVKEFKVQADATRADRSFTIRSTMTNAQSTHDQYRRSGDVAAQSDLFGNGLFHTHTLAYQEGAAIVKAHESVRLWTDDILANSILYDSALSATPPAPAFDNTAVTVWNLWVNAVQAESGLAFAMCSHLIAMFAGDNTASFEVEYPIRYSADAVSPDAVGDVHNLTGIIPTALSHLNFARSLVVGVACDYQLGISKVRYFVCP